jgi:hypothetical protein
VSRLLGFGRTCSPVTHRRELRTPVSAVLDVDLSQRGHRYAGRRYTRCSVSPSSNTLFDTSSQSRRSSEVSSNSSALWTSTSGTSTSLYRHLTLGIAAHGNSRSTTRRMPRCLATVSHGNERFPQPPQVDRLVSPASPLHSGGQWSRPFDGPAGSCRLPTRRICVEAASVRLPQPATVATPALCTDPSWIAEQLVTPVGLGTLFVTYQLPRTTET